MPANKNIPKGFTLIELLIVVAILVIIGIALLVGINPIAQIFKGYDARRKNDLSQIKIALENYYADHECYPEFPSLDERGKPTYTCDSTFLKPYLNSVPCDPNTKLPYTINLQPPYDACPQQFAVYAEVSALFDSQANSIPYCPKTIAASSSNMTPINLINGCSTENICTIHYGCINARCVKISDGEIPSCSPNYCENDCNGLCGNLRKACVK